MPVVSFHYPAVDLDDLAAIRHLIEEKSIDFGADEDKAGELVMAVNEAITNIIVHGYQGQPGYLQVELEWNEVGLRIWIRDRAARFDPTQMPTVDISVPLDQRSYGGMGVHMMRVFTDELHYRQTPAGENELILVKRLATQHETI